MGILIVFNLWRRSSAVVASSRMRLIRTARSAVNAPRRRCDLEVQKRNRRDHRLFCRTRGQCDCGFL